MGSHINTQPQLMRKIGITGGMASGKSMVADLLLQMIGDKHLDADQVCRELLEPGQEGWEAFTEVYGKEFLLDDKSINRSKLRKALFANDRFREEGS